MSVITLRVTNEKHDRIKNLAVSRGVSVNKLLDEAMTLMIAKYDIDAGIALLDKVRQ